MKNTSRFITSAVEGANVLKNTAGLCGYSARIAYALEKPVNKLCCDLIDKDKDKETTSDTEAKPKQLSHNRTSLARDIDHVYSRRDKRWRSNNITDIISDDDIKPPRHSCTSSAPDNGKRRSDEFRYDQQAHGCDNECRDVFIPEDQSTRAVP